MSDAPKRITIQSSLTAALDRGKQLNKYRLNSSPTLLDVEQVMEMLKDT